MKNVSNKNQIKIYISAIASLIMLIFAARYNKYLLFRSFYEIIFFIFYFSFIFSRNFRRYVFKFPLRNLSGLLILLFPLNFGTNNLFIFPERYFYFIQEVVLFPMFLFLLILIILGILYYIKKLNQVKLFFYLINSILICYIIFIFFYMTPLYTDVLKWKMTDRFKQDNYDTVCRFRNTNYISYPTQLIERGEKKPIYFYYIGYGYFRELEYKEALKYLTKLREKNIEDKELKKEAYKVMAECFIGIGMHDTALEIYEDLKDEYPDDLEIDAGMAASYFGLREKDTALEIYNEIKSKLKGKDINSVIFPGLYRLSIEKYAKRKERRLKKD